MYFMLIQYIALGSFILGLAGVFSKKERSSIAEERITKNECVIIREKNGNQIFIRTHTRTRTHTSYYENKIIK